MNRLHVTYTILMKYYLWQMLTSADHPEAVAVARSRYEAFAAARNEVRLLGTRHNILLTWCREHWPCLQLPALFSEIFDIPKYEENQQNQTDEAAADGAAAAELAASATVAVSSRPSTSSAPSTSGASSSQGSQFSQLG